MTEPEILEQVRKICLALPEMSERQSHGEPTWFYKTKKSMVMYADRHHDDKLAFWCAAPEGVQAALIDADPDRFFRPPYAGHRGWVGVRLDRDPLDWATIETIIQDAWETVSQKR